MSPVPRFALPVGYDIGGYKIVRFIGAGGFGIVYEAVDPVLRNRVAIKEYYQSAMLAGSTVVLHESAHEPLHRAILERFEYAATLQFALNHKNLLRVLNYIKRSNTGYMISEFIDGAPLRKHLGQKGHFESEQSFRSVMEQVVGAAGYLHRQGYLHRDISPENIMIDKSGRPVLIDFGSLKRDFAMRDIPSSMVQMAQDYCALEQHNRNTPERFYTDIFALAGTMYYALAGEPPARVFVRANDVVYNRPDPYVPIERVSKIPCRPEVYRAINRALRLAVQDRPQTIEEFAGELGWKPDYGEAQQKSDLTRLTVASEIGFGRTIPDRPPPTLPPLDPPQAFWRKYAGVAAAIAAMVLLLLGILQAQSSSSGIAGNRRMAEVASEPRRSPPADSPAIANGTYRGIRGFNTQRGVECHTRYDIVGIEISNGRITMETGGFRWEGTIDQKTGVLNIPDEGIRNMATGQRPKYGLSISGDYRNATLSSGLCGPGYFRITK